MQISVIIPTFNRAHTLPRALDSVLGQRQATSEILVIDDGSTDHTRQLMQTQYADCRYLYQSNQGVSAARNHGIRASRYDWIALLDSDDAWLPDKLQRQQQALQNQPGYRLCHTDEIWIRNGVRVNPMKKHTKSGGRIFSDCLPRCVISPSAALLHRSLFEQIGLFDTNLPACEDYDLWLRICAREPVLYLEKPLVVKYGGHADQLSRAHWGMDRFRIHALEKIIQSGTLSASDRTAAVEMLQQKSHILAQGAEKRGHRHRAEEYRKLMQAYRL
ncbi:MAG: glycosyltransferase [Chromatiales bacterium]|jgi:glycosyltransferase involved in cell wall biosynthesis